MLRQYRRWWMRWSILSTNKKREQTLHKWGLNFDETLSFPRPSLHFFLLEVVKWEHTSTKPSFVTLPFVVVLLLTIHAIVISNGLILVQCILPLLLVYFYAHSCFCKVAENAYSTSPRVPEKRGSFVTCAWQVLITNTFIVKSVKADGTFPSSRTAICT